MNPYLILLLTNKILKIILSNFLNETNYNYSFEIPDKKLKRILVLCDYKEGKNIRKSSISSRLMHKNHIRDLISCHRMYPKAGYIFLKKLAQEKFELYYSDQDLKSFSCRLPLTKENFFMLLDLANNDEGNH